MAGLWASHQPVAAMFSEKLISLLQTFSKYELNRFRKFLLSPYLNDQEDLTRLFDVVNEALRKDEYALAKLDKQKVWKSLYPTQSFDDAHLRRLASDLNQMALRFMVEEHRNQNALSEALELQKVLEKPDLSKHLNGVERRIERLLAHSEGKSSDYYFAQFQLHWNIFSRASKVVATTGYAEKLSSADFFLECYYLAQKLKLYIAWLLYRGFRVTEHEVPVMPGFWEYLQDKRFADIPLIRIYRKVILCFVESEQEIHFQEMLKDLQQFANEITKSDLRECYYMAQNYAALKINQGKTEYYRKVFDIFNNMMEQEILVENRQLPEAVFKNVITVSLGVGEYEWTEQFIQRYSEFLPVNIRENARMFNLAYLYFYQKNYDKAIEYLRDVEYNDVVYALGAKSILLRTYYERGEMLALDSLMDSFRNYLRRNKVISKNLKREYNNFIYLVKKLTTITPQDKKSIASLRRQISETSYSMPKNWLLKKIAEIEENQKSRGTG
ncbi:MAG: hypothetical protein KF734_12390 [Saprospiraceae bacterium]|nr:hypothetical protein [Saprospiraceae bacterium]